MKTSLIIPVAGKGTRLSKFFFTKALLPLHNEPILNKIISFWGADYTIIVCNSNNIDMIRSYTQNKYHYIINDKKGSAFSVKEALDYLSSFNVDQIIVNWCDVLPQEKYYGNIIYVSKTIPCRCNLNFGGAIGVYLWRPNEVKFEPKESLLEVDLIEVLPLDKFKEQVIEAIDIGDEEKYTSNLREIERPIRSFNKIIIDETIVTKFCFDERLKQAEENWYKQLGFLDFIPTPISYNPLVLKRINGSQKFYKTKKLYKMAKQIHECKLPIPTNKDDCELMYITKTINRLKSIEYLLPFKDNFIVNGELCYNPVKKLKSIDIEKYLPTNFVPIHGDLTTSNVLWEKNKPYIIDPRGIFGNSFLYGDADYDLAKIYYSITKWHLLNKGSLVPNVIEKNKFQIEEIKTIGDEKLDFLLAIIWLSVAEYVKSNVLSLLFAYLRGSLLLTRWFDFYYKRN